MSEQLTYEDVLEYLGDREGDWATLSSDPTFSSGGDPGPTMLGLTVGVGLGRIVAVEQHLADAFLDGRAGARIELHGAPDVAVGEGLVLTREWFGAATLGDNAGTLALTVRADLGARPFYPPVGEVEEDAARAATPYGRVGWGFYFDFDGSPPLRGRWSRGRGGA